MPPVKMRDMPEERKQNFIALKQEVKIPELIAVLLKDANPQQTAVLERTLGLYNDGQLRGRTRTRSPTGPSVPLVQEQLRASPPSCSSIRVRSCCLYAVQDGRWTAHLQDGVRGARSGLQPRALGAARRPARLFLPSKCRVSRRALAGSHPMCLRFLAQAFTYEHPIVV